MVEVIVHVDCDTAPQKALLRDFLIAFAEANMTFVLDCVSEDVIWEVVGSARIVGKVAFEMTVRRPNPNKTVALTIEHIIVEEQKATMSGHFVLADKTMFSFCDIYHFKEVSDNTITLIKSYNVKMP